MPRSWARPGSSTVSDPEQPVEREPPIRREPEDDLGTEGRRRAQTSDAILTTLPALDVAAYLRAGGLAGDHLVAARNLLI